eukprot:m.270331 g.270331  ORF g.270331 m.270331 type:complete len:940 (-) comp19313_c0_seq1:120-2939(-)
MLFMGSKEYPLDNDFDSFLSKHGGSSNAHTDFEQTCFVFEVKRSHLRPSLHRFAQFFCTPLMKAESAQREMQAVDSEFQSSTQLDGERFIQLLSHLAAKDNPLSNFPWGNLETLDVRPKTEGVAVDQFLRSFWENEYSASRMTLCLLGKESLDELETMAREFFAGVPSNGAGPKSFTESPPPFGVGLLGTSRVLITPVQKRHELVLLWVLPPQLPKYRQKPSAYVADTLGHEGPGSVLSLLKARGWATALGAGNSGSGYESCSNYSFFQVEVTLTEAGVGHVDEIIEAVLSYLGMLRRLGPQDWFFKECQTIAENNFRFQSEPEPYDFVESVSCNMQLYDPADLLTGDTLLMEYDSDGITAILGTMVSSAMIEFVTSPSCESVCTETEPWFETRYVIQTVDEPTRQRRLRIDNGQEHPFGDALRFPPKNDLIASNFDLIEHLSGTQGPELLQQTPFGNTWHQPDSRFLLPRGDILVQWITPVASESALHSVMASLLVMVLELNMNEVTYNAAVAGMSQNLSCNSRGLSLHVTGYSEKLPVLLEMILEHLRTPEVTAGAFDMCKEKYVLKLQNFLRKPDRLARSIRLQLLERCCWSPEDKLTALKTVTLESLQAFSSHILSRAFVDCLVHGNVSAEGSEQIGAMIRSKLPALPLPKGLHPSNAVCIVPVGTSVLARPNYNTSDPNTAVECYFQISQEGDSAAESLRVKVIAEVLETLMDEPLFQCLRTEQQLGYDVSCSSRLTHGKSGFMVFVQTQAHKFSAQDVNQRIDAFLHNFAEVLQNYDKDVFRGAVDALAADKRQPTLSMGSESYRLWYEIGDRAFLFQRPTIEADLLDRMSLDEVRKVYMACLAPTSPTRRKIAVFVQGHADNATQSDTKTPEEDHGHKQEQDTDMMGEGQERNLDRFDAPLVHCFNSVPTFRSDLAYLPAEHDRLAKVMTEC